MTLRQRTSFILRRLGELYPRPPVPLYHRDPFTLLVAVLLSAQCTDARVNQVTPCLFTEAADPESMCRLPVSKILEIIRPCGLAPTKAKAIAGLSRILMEAHGGRVPNQLDALEALPGVGHKTASVVLTQAFGMPAFPVDTHIHRCAQRWGLTKGKNVRHTEEDLKRCFPRESWRDLHIQFILYGREHCTARACDGTHCEICRTCYPRRRKAVKTRKA